MKPSFLAAAGFAIAATLAHGAPAQNAASAPPPVSAEPQATSATYGNWVLRCTNAGTGAQAQHVCEVVQSFQIQGQQGLSAALAIGRIGGPKEPLRVTFIMFPNVGFPSTVKLALDDKDPAPVELAWLRCTPSGCVAEGAFKDDELKRWRIGTGNGQLRFKDAGSHDVTWPVSLQGLPQALDGLAKTP